MFICLTQLVKVFATILQICCTFSRIMFLKSDLFYFVLVAKAYGFCLRARAVNSDHILNVLETVKFVFCLQIHALAECTYIQLVHVFVNKTLTTVSNP